MSDETGFLTDVDKEFLRGEKEYDSKQGRYGRRRAIRERTRQAFYDFQMLHNTLDEAELNKIFDPPAEETSELMRAMIDSIAFLYHALEGDPGSNAVDWERTFRYPFGQVLEAGVQHGEIARQEANGEHHFAGNPEVTFDVDVTRVHPADRDRVVEALARNSGRGLTDKELKTAIVHAADDTPSTGPEPVIDGEPPEDALDDYHGSGLHGLATEVEQKAKELDESDDVDE
jgi:hypothetical protein